MDSMMALHKARGHSACVGMDSPRWENFGVHGFQSEKPLQCPVIHPPQYLLPHQPSIELAFCFGLESARLVFDTERLLRELKVDGKRFNRTSGAQNLDVCRHIRTKKRRPSKNSDTRNCPVPDVFVFWIQLFFHATPPLTEPNRNSAFDSLSRFCLHGKSDKIWQYVENKIQFASPLAPGRFFLFRYASAGLKPGFRPSFL